VQEKSQNGSSWEEAISLNQGKPWEPTPGPELIGPLITGSH
jgi:hypothetical protein